MKTRGTCRRRAARQNVRTHNSSRTTANAQDDGGLATVGSCGNGDPKSRGCRRVGGTSANSMDVERVEPRRDGGVLCVWGGEEECKIQGSVDGRGEKSEREPKDAREA